jgi:phage gp46-like protein
MRVDPWADYLSASRAPELLSMVALRLGTWRRAMADDGVTPLGGWWGAVLGTRSWLLLRAGLTDDAVERAAGYTREALADLVTLGILGDVAVDAERVGKQIRLAVTATRPDGEAQTLTYPDLWEVLQ